MPMEDMVGLPDEGLTWRLAQAAEAVHRSERLAIEDQSDMGEDRIALSRSLQRLIEQARSGSRKSTDSAFPRRDSRY